VEYIDRHECEIRLDDDFPERPPSVRWLTPIYHPNVSFDGSVNLEHCGLVWTADQNLGVVCERMWDLARLAWMDLDKATNRSAKDFFSKQQDIALPLDDRPLRDLAAASPSNIVQSQDVPASQAAGPSPTVDDGILYINDNTPTPDTPQRGPDPRRPSEDDDILHIGDD
jgi:hypothetical protein